MNHLVRILKNLGVKFIFVETSGGLRKALRFYRSHGFKKKMEIPKYWDNHSSLICMVKEIK